MNEANNNLPQDEQPNEQVGVNLSGKKKWDKQQRQTMYIACAAFVVLIAITIFTKDEQLESGKASSLARAPSEVAKVVPGDELPPAAQQQIEEANKQRAAAAVQESKSVMDSAPPINNKPPPPVKEDMPPPSSEHTTGGQGQQRLAFDPKLAEAKAKAMQELQKRWQATNTVKFVVFEEDKAAAQAIQMRQMQQMQASQTATQQPQKTVAKGNHIPAGATFYAIWDKSMNSDTGPSMAKATIHGGDLDGAVFMGKHERKDSQMLVHFTTLTFKGQTIPIDAIAVNAETTADSVATAIDNHTFSRWLALAGASFLEGAANMAERSGQTMASSFGGPVVATNYGAKELIAGTVGNLGRRSAQIAGGYFNTPPTLTTEKDEELGVIFATQTEDYTWLPKIAGL